MPDVQPLHQPVQGWRSFVLHVLTITMGLLVALAVVTGVAWIYRHHVAAGAREAIRREVEDNRRVIAGDRRSLAADETQMRANMTTLRALMKDPRAKTSLIVSWSWSAPANSAWTTARERGALTQMRAGAVQMYSALYSQQQAVNEEANALMRAQSKVVVPIMIEGDTRDASVTQIEESLHRCAEAVVEMDLLDDMMRRLDQSYEAALRTG